MDGLSVLSALADHRLLITGGTGSFGRHIARFLVRQGRLRELVVFSRDEEKQRRLRVLLEGINKHNTRLNFVLGDVRDLESLSGAMRDIDVVVNAAALKQVPACELNAFEAVKTNIIGMQHVLTAASLSGVSNVLTISTDKAVKPINAMGISKAMQERLVQSHSLRHPNPRLTIVRYGNVLGSTGSVLPVFVRQLETTGRLSVTDPAMTRFLLTLDDAMGLVAFALQTPTTSGTTFVRRASVVTVAAMATVVLEVFGDGDLSRIDIIGARPGDKNHEVLVSEDEVRRAMSNELFFTIPPVMPSDRPGDAGHSEDGPVEYTSADAEQLSVTELEKLVRDWQDHDRTDWS